MGQQCLQHSATDQPRYRLMAKSIGVRFWEKVNCAAPCQCHMSTNCWEWQGCTSWGYGHIHLKGKNEKAHRVMLAWVLGHRPAYVMHLCDNRACVRPSHLKEGTHMLNMLDAIAKGRLYTAPRRFAPGQVTDMRHRYNSGETLTTIATLYATTPSHISKIVKRKSYKNVA